MLLPKIFTQNGELSLLQTKWISILNPLLSAPANNSILIPNVSLINGATTINHGLGRIPQGWMIVDIDHAATIYRSAPMTDLTITLTSSAAAIATLEIF